MKIKFLKRELKEDYVKEAKAAYQQITDLIERFQTIDAAIVDSNAKTEISTSYGKIAIAGAISLRSRLRGGGAYDGEADLSEESRISYRVNMMKELAL